MPSMVRKLSALAIALLYLSTLSATALAAPPTMNLSSWEPVVENGAIVGGTQTVTITNITSEAMGDVTFSLANPPCDCVVTESAASDGRVEPDAWVIGELGPGATATLTLSYGEPSSPAVGVPAGNPPLRVGAALAVVGLAIAVGAVLGHRRRLTPAIA